MSSQKSSEVGIRRDEGEIFGGRPLEDRLVVSMVKTDLTDVHRVVTGFA